MILNSKVEEEFAEYRLDQFLSIHSGGEISRTSIQKWIKSGHIKRIEPPSNSLKSSQKVHTGEEYEITIPPRPKIGLEPVQMDIPIIYEEDDFVVINKPAGLASHGGPGDDSPSLVNGLLYHFKELSGVAGEIRPGIVHRLDKMTSGLMVIAKTDRAHIALAEFFQKRTIEKKYFAWLVQTPRNPEGRIELSIGRHPKERLKMCIRPDGRKAITNYKIIKSIISRKGRHFSLAEIQIETGRTHQIRVHFQHLGSPVVGDMLYSRTGSEYSKYGLLLFAQKLKFNHPFIKKKVMEFELPFPERFVLFEKEAQFH